MFCINGQRESRQRGDIEAGVGFKACDDFIRGLAFTA